MPALPPYIIEPIWQQFLALLPSREVNHPLGCHRPRIPDHVVFEKLIQVLVFGCAYLRIADGSCSATTLRRRRDEWIEAGAMEALEELALESYDRIVGLELSDVAVDGCITKAPCGGEKAGKARWIEANGASSAPQWWTPTASLWESFRLQPIVTTPRFWLPPSTPWRRWGCRQSR